MKILAVPKETGINFWLKCCVFRATDIPLFYLTSGEGGNCAASGCLQLLESQMMRKQHCLKEKGNVGRSRKCSSWKSGLSRHVDTWQALASKWKFKPAPVLTGFVYFSLRLAIFTADIPLVWVGFFSLYLRLILDVTNVSLDSS